MGVPPTGEAHPSSQLSVPAADIVFADDEGEPPEVCVRCKFWARKDAEDGECRIGRPVGHVVTREDGEVVALGMWPETTAWSWCGEYA